MVATVENDRIHMVPVIIGRDFGSAIEILNGIKEGDLIVTDVTDEVVDNAEVKTHMTKAPEEQPQKAPSQAVPVGGDTQYGNQGITDRNLQGQQQQQNNKGSGGQQKGSPKSETNSRSKQ